MKNNVYMSIIDALIFASEIPLPAQKIKQIIEDVSHEELKISEIHTIIEEINNTNRETRRGFYLQEVAGGYQLRTRPSYAPWIKRLRRARPMRMTQSTLETLAIVAYRQPVIRAEIEKIRGVESGGIIKNLLERNLIRIVGRKDVPGRPFMLGTTRKFLEVFGLERLADLPTLKDFETLDASMLPSILTDKLSPNTVSESIDGITEGNQSEDINNNIIINDDDDDDCKCSSTAEEA